MVPTMHIRHGLKHNAFLSPGDMLVKSKRPEPLTEKKNLLIESTMKDEDIQKKLVELESAILKESGPESGSQLSTRESSRAISETKRDDMTGPSSSSGMSESTKSDLHYFGGIFLLLVGMIMLFQHVRVTSGYMTWWGISTGDSIGVLLVLLTIGIGWIVYNSRSLWGWLIGALSLFTIIFSIVSGLRIHFYPVSMLQMIFMLLPFAFGAGFLLKGLGGPKGLEEVVKTRIEKHED